MSSDDRTGARRGAHRGRGEDLTEQEGVVMGKVEDGETNRDIADGLTITVSTVKTHVRHAFEKLGVHSRTRAIRRLRELREAAKDHPNV